MYCIPRYYDFLISHRALAHDFLVFTKAGLPRLFFTFVSALAIGWMAPKLKKTYKPNEIARLARLELDDALEAWEVTVPSRALDLERRAMLARKIHGGVPCCLQCSAAAANAPAVPWLSLQYGLTLVLNVKHSHEVTITEAARKSSRGPPGSSVKSEAAGILFCQC